MRERRGFRSRSPCRLVVAFVALEAAVLLVGVSPRPAGARGEGARTCPPSWSIDAPRSGTSGTLGALAILGQRDVWAVGNRGSISS
jgi:hypothetical protein